MRFRFVTDELRELYEGKSSNATYGRDLVRAFRKKMGLIDAAETEQDLRAMNSLHFEKLVGDRAGQHSIRLNKQWRLILELERDENGRLLAIIEIDDYH